MFKTEVIIHDVFPDHLINYIIDIRYRFGAVYEGKKTWRLRYKINAWCKENIEGIIYINVAADSVEKFGLYYMPFLTFENKDDELKYILRWFENVKSNTVEEPLL